jgi:NAD+ kinase
MNAPAVAVRRVGVLVHPERDGRGLLETIARWAGDEIELLAAREQTGLVIDAARCVDEAQLGAQSDLMIAVGGDGTVLRALRTAAPSGVPVLGVNLGRLGFLAEVDDDDLSNALASISRGDYAVERRSSAAYRVVADGREPERGVAYNDVVLSRVPGRGPATLAVEVEHRVLARYAADALIVATPTGSTAYNFSVGGPIVSPRLAGLLISPVAPHGTFRSTVVLHPDERLDVEVLERSAPLVLEADGRERAELGPGDRLEAGVGDHPGLVVRVGGSGFYERARTRLQLRDSAQISGHAST